MKFKEASEFIDKDSEKNFDKKMIYKLKIRI